MEDEIAGNVVPALLATFISGLSTGIGTFFLFLHLFLLLHLLSLYNDLSTELVLSLSLPFFTTHMNSNALYRRGHDIVLWTAIKFKDWPHVELFFWRDALYLQHPSCVLG
jgi:hypothetical protein